MTETLAPAPIVFRGNLKDASEPLLHAWEHTVGSGHATLALRADWQRQLARCRKELGFRHVRLHGLLNDDMGTLMMENDQLVYSFFNADQIFDFLLSINMKPFVELSFMPSTLSSGDTIVFHYKGNVTPPRDYAAWGALMAKLAAHWVERYGIGEIEQWFFEVWNEPNLKAFWTGSQEDYFRLYKTTSESIKGIDPRLKVGGPATAGNAWIPEFLDYCRKNALNPDFISTHHYPTDAFGKPGDDTIAQLAASSRSVLRDQAQTAKAQSGDRPLYYTEWCTSSNPFDDLHDRPYASAFIIKTVLECRNLVQGYSYWTFSDIFEENYFSSVPFHGGFGLTTIYGTPKPAFRAYELLHRLGSELIALDGNHPTVDAWLARATGALQLLVSNHALPRHPVKTELVRFELRNAPLIRSATIERIDEENANARGRWEEMGKPDSLQPAGVEALELASQMTKRPHSIQISEIMVSLELWIPPHGVALITLEID